MLTLMDRVMPVIIAPVSPIPPRKTLYLRVGTGAAMLVNARATLIMTWMWMAVMQQLLKQIMAEVRTKDPVPMPTPVTAILPAMVMLTDLTLHHLSRISAEVHTKPPVPPA